MLATDQPDPALLSALRDYIGLVLQAPLEIEPGQETARTPAFLVERYWLIAAWLLERKCLLLIPRPGTEETPAAIARHRDLLQKKAPGKLIIFVSATLSTHNRHRLIGRHVPFVIPGNQLYIPQLAFDLREHFRKPPEVPDDYLSPVAQFLVIAALLGSALEGESATSLSNEYHYASMSLGRALDELSSLGLMEVTTFGRFREISAILDRKQLWRRARPLLRSPVRKVRQVPYPPADIPALLAGESALAERTDLAPPRIETRAIAAGDWKAFARQFELDRPASWEESIIQLQTWTYDPRPLGNHDMVDPISLWLSLPDSSDERLAAAKDKLLEEVKL